MPGQKSHKILNCQGAIIWHKIDSYTFFLCRLEELLMLSLRTADGLSNKVCVILYKV